jgi:hypothetical protein
MTPTRIGNLSCRPPPGGHGEVLGVQDNSLDHSLGRVVDDLGVTHEIGPDEDVRGAVVLITVQEPDGHLSLRCAWSEGMTWIERIGLLRAAERAELPENGAEGWRA